MASIRSEEIPYGPLTRLSLQQCRPGFIPSAPTNQERLQAYRDTLPVVLANAHPWPHLERSRSSPEPSSK